MYFSLSSVGTSRNVAKPKSVTLSTQRPSIQQFVLFSLPCDFSFDLWMYSMPCDANEIFMGDQELVKWETWSASCSGGSRGRKGSAPLLGSKCLHFYTVYRKFCQLVGWHPYGWCPPGEILDPPLSCSLLQLFWFDLCILDTEHTYTRVWNIWYIRHSAQFIIL